MDAQAGQIHLPGVNHTQGSDSASLTVRRSFNQSKPIEWHYRNAHQFVSKIEKELFVLLWPTKFHYSPQTVVSTTFTSGCTPLNTVPILFCVKAFSKNRHFRVFIMIKIGQTHVFLKDYVHIHQIGSHFVGGYRLDFSATGQEPRRSFCKLLALGSPRLL